MGPLLLTRHTRHHLATAASSRTCVYERLAFYPIEPADVRRRFGPWDEARDASLWRTIEERSVAVHYWNALSKNLPLVCDSFVHRLLEGNCVVCADLPCVERAGVRTIPGDRVS